MLTQKVSGVSYVADHSMRQLQLQAVTQWDSQWDLLHFFPNNAGLLPALTEAPWKEFGTGESVATDPKWGLVCDFSFKATSQRCKSDNTRTSYHTQGDLCQRADLTTVQIELSLFADSLNSWIPRVVFSFCYSSRGIRIWCSLPPLPAWLVLSTLKHFKTMKLSMSAWCMHAATSLNLQEWVCPLDGWTPWTECTSPPPTSAPWTQELNLSCEMMFLYVFVSVFKMNSEDSLDQQQATNPARRRQRRYAGESDHPQRRKLPIPVSSPLGVSSVALAGHL